MFASRIDRKDELLREDIESLKKDVAELLERARSSSKEAPTDCPRAVDQLRERLEYHGGWPAAVRLLIEWVEIRVNETE